MVMSQNKPSKEKFPLGLDFFSFFVHELKSPLMSLKLQLDDLAMHSQKKEFKEAVSAMETDLDRLFRFIHDALEMKESEKEGDLSLQWTNWQGLLTKNVEKFEKWLFNEDLKIENNTESAPIEVFLDPKWADSVISNLLVNAIQHSPRGSNIHLNTKLKKDGSIVFSISDEGKGLEPGMEDKVFHRFQSHRKSWPDSVFKGTGLGLFISKAIMEKHRGKIGVFSRRKSGCTFYVSFPQARLENLKQAV